MITSRDERNEWDGKGVAAWVTKIVTVGAPTYTATTGRTAWRLG